MPFWAILACKSLLALRAEGRAGGALMTRGWFPTLSGVALDKLPWFAMVLSTSGGSFALHKYSSVYRWVGGNIVFWAKIQ